MLSRPCSWRSRPSRTARGLTLIELIVTSVILAIIVPPLALGVVAYVRSTDATSARVAQSSDAQRAGAYFTADVASLGLHNWTDSAHSFPLVQSVEQNLSDSAGTHPCGAGGTTILRLEHDSFTSSSSSSPTILTEAWSVRTTSGLSQLHRMTCSSASPSPSTPLTDVTLAYDLASPPALTCTSTCTASTPPQGITLSLTLTGPSTTPYPVALTAQRRQT